MLLDYMLLGSAVYVYNKTRCTDAALLLVYFTGSVFIVELLTCINIFDKMGYYWFVIYSCWITIFIIITKKLSIIVLYIIHQILCLLVVITWHSTIDLFYDAYGFVVATIYLLQLGCANGNIYFDSIYMCDNSHLRMAYHRF